MVEAMLKLCSSWSPDTFLKDSYTGTDHSYSFDTSNTDGSNERFEEFPICTESPINSLNGSSSEGSSDWATLEDDISSILPVTDGSVSLLLDESFVESICVGDLNWSELESFNDQTTSDDIVLDSTGVSHASKKKGKRKRSPENIPSTSQWSSMSREKQMETIEALTQIISQNMTLREQKEVISIIDPTAVISPNDTEFAIDLESLNDSKLQIIRDIVKKHAVMSKGTDSTVVQPSSVTHKCSSGVTSKIKSTKKQDFEKRPYLKEIELRQRKLLKQNKKEKRSGLFVHEKKIKRLNNSPREEDEDVNILE